MKERLLGAAVLVVAAVLVIPMLLDGPDRDTGQVSQDLKLPAPESASARTHVVELDPTGVAGAEDPQPVTDAAVADQTPAAPASAVDLPAAPAAAPQPLAAPAAAQPGWAVQVGSFTSESNARRLEKLLQESDYPVFVTRNVVQGRVMYRVRVGPEPDRAGAEALAERLQADRQATQIVEHP